MRGPPPGGDVAGKDAPPALGEVALAGSVGSVAAGAGARSWLATRPCSAVSGAFAEETAPGPCAAATCGPAMLPPVEGALPGTWSGYGGKKNKKHEQPHARQSASATLPAFARPQHQQARVAKGKLTTPPSARILPGLYLQKQHLQPTSANKSNLPAWSSSKSSFASVSVLGAAPARGRSQQR